MKKHSLKEIIQVPIATLYHVCEGNVVYLINFWESAYLLTINSNDDEWKATYLLPEMKPIHLMRWIRRGMENQDGSFIQVK